MNSRRKHDGSKHHYVDPSVQLNAGLWSLFAGATVFLALRIWIKITRRHGLWYDDHILLVTWVRGSLRYFTHPEPRLTSSQLILAINNSLISLEFATGYVCVSLAV
jgi:hypothetical protein